MNSVLQNIDTKSELRILVVDDDQDFSESLGELLESRGYVVAIAASVEEAEQMARSFLPAVAFIDIRLGAGNGNKLITMLRKVQPEPVCVMMTGYASTESSIEALKSGAFDYLTKPVLPEDLLVTLERCRDRLRLEQERREALAALEIRNADLENINQRLKNIVECMSGLTGSHSVADLCHQLLEKVARSMGAAGGSVYLREGDRLILAHSLDPGHAPPVIPMPLKPASVLGRVMHQAEAVLVPDAASSDGLMLCGWSGYRDESLLALPLTEKGEIIGVLSLHTKQQPPFTPQDRDIGRILLAASSETLRAVRALEELQASKSMLQLIIDSEPECVKVLDMDRNLIQMNPAGLAMIEADSLEDVAGNCVDSIVNPGDRNAFRKLTERVFAGESGVLEFAVTGLRGTRRQLEIHAVPLRDASQKIIGLLGVTRDITESRNLMEKSRLQELQLMQASKMAALGTLVAGVAHEINNPNQTIQINSGLVNRVWDDATQVLDQHALENSDFRLAGLPYSEMKTEYTSMIHDINDAAQQIKIVVERLRDFARPYNRTHGRRQGVSVRLNEAVETAVALLMHSIRKRTGNFHCELGEGLPLIVGIQQHLQQIVINLVLNSLDALPDKTCGVSIRTQLNDDQSCVELQVSDEGVGIESDDMEQVMEPFFTTKRDTGGTGLGLSITHSLVQELGGALRIESTPGKGTVVVASFPVTRH